MDLLGNEDEEKSNYIVISFLTFQQHLSKEASLSLSAFTSSLGSV